MSEKPTGLTPEQQLDVLWKALGSLEHWLSVNVKGELTLSGVVGNGGIGTVEHALSGTRDEILEQLNAMQIADRLEDKPSRRAAPEPPDLKPGLFDAMGRRKLRL